MSEIFYHKRREAKREQKRTKENKRTREQENKKNRRTREESSHFQNVRDFL